MIKGIIIVKAIAAIYNLIEHYMRDTVPNRVCKHMLVLDLVVILENLGYLLYSAIIKTISDCDSHRIG